MRHSYESAVFDLFHTIVDPESSTCSIQLLTLRSFDRRATDESSLLPKH